ncbi:MAG TPA: YCF48-related protein [Rhodocyclaceae bacterium]|nr:YCF48-related protein [Rhodocyclaceae bacterium]
MQMPLFSIVSLIFASIVGMHLADAAETAPAKTNNSNHAQVISAELLALWADPAGKFILAGGRDGALRRSTDGGDHWQQIDIKGALEIDSFAASPKGTLLAITKDQLLRSTDEGQTWAASALPAEQQIAHAIFHRASSSWIATGRSGTLLKSKNEGKTWTAIRSKGNDAPLLALAETSNGTLLAAGNKGTLLRSADGGSHWSAIPTNTQSVIARFLSLPGDTGVLSLWADGSITGVRPDGRGEWHSSTGRPEYLSAATIDTPHHQLLVANSFGQVMRSNDNGMTWKASLIAERMYISALHVDPHDGDIIAIGARANIARSHDGGASWELTTGNAWTSRLNALAVNQSGDLILAAGTGGLMLRSTDRGQSWTSLHPDLARYVGEIIAVPGTAALVVAGNDGLIARSVDGGHDWSIIKSGMPAEISIQSMIYDPHSASLLACGPMATILRSGDAGVTWQVIQSVPRAGEGFLKQLVIDPDTDALLAVGSPGLVMRSTDGGHSWTPTDAEVGSGIEQVVAAGKGIFLAARTDGQILRSTDDGTHWQTVGGIFVNTPSGTYWDAQSGTVWVMGLGTLVESKDGGATWRKASIPGTASMNFMTRTRAGKTLLAFGKNGAIMRSVDNGANWQPIRSASSSSLRKPLIDPKTGAIYVAGRDGTVLRSTDDGVHWTAIPVHTAAHLNRLALDASTHSLIATGERIVRIELP